MTSEGIDYGGVYAKLMELVGETVDVAIRGVERRPPMLAYTEGVLKVKGDTYLSEDLRAIVGWDRDALRVSVGDLDLTLHPDHFVDATWTVDQARLLKVVYGSIELDFRAPSRRAENPG
jgi:hypothetical protein